MATHEYARQEQCPNAGIPAIVTDTACVHQGQRRGILLSETKSANVLEGKDRHGHLPYSSGHL